MKTPPQEEPARKHCEPTDTRQPQPRHNTTHHTTITYTITGDRQGASEQKLHPNDIYSGRRQRLANSCEHRDHEKIRATGTQTTTMTTDSPAPQPAQPSPLPSTALTTAASSNAPSPTSSASATPTARKKSKLNARVALPDPPAFGFGKDFSLHGQRSRNAGRDTPSGLSQSISASSSPVNERPERVKDTHTRPKSAAPMPRMSSYPFPSVASPPKSSAPPNIRLPRVKPEMFERPMSSGTPTPISFAASPFLPRSLIPLEPAELEPENAEFPTPNLYDLTLLLNSEPGLEGFWSNLVKIFTTCYKADRMSLSIPTDATDLENTPWGQKATFNIAEDDALSLAYMSEGGAVGDTTHLSDTDDDDAGVPLSEEDRVRLGSRVTAPDAASVDEEFGLTGDSEGPFSPVTVEVSPGRSDLDASGGLSTTREDKGRLLVDELASQYPFLPADKMPHGRIFPSLQPLSFEADGLLDGAGVTRILQRGKPVILSREYREVACSEEEIPPGEDEDVDRDTVPPLDTSPPPAIVEGPFSQPPTPLEFVGRRLRGITPKDARRPQSEYASSFSFSAAHARKPRKSIPFEEYEQCVTSPWSQSPAPSPAIKRDPNENPFFAMPKVDEGSFSPTECTPEYVPHAPVPAIGLESSWTVVHIPLIHPSVYKVLYGTSEVPNNKRNRNSRGSEGSTAGFVSSPRFLVRTPSGNILQQQPNTERKAPMAILSILSPAIPYPKNLLHSLKCFAPIISTAYALAQSHSAMFTQLEYLRSKRPSMPVGMEPFGIEEHNSAWENQSSSSSSSDSISTSRYVSARNSRITSPTIPHHEDFNSLNAPRAEVDESTVVGAESARESGKGNQTGQSPSSASASPSATSNSTTSSSVSFLRRPASFWPFSRQNSSETAPTVPPRALVVRTDPAKRDSLDTMLKRAAEKLGLDGKDKKGEKEGKRTRSSKRRRGKKVNNEPSAHLHSHGADYAATFQSLAATTAVDCTEKNAANASQMAPPSNRLLRTIIDSIPVHVFTAAPQSGQTTWINARMLAYRGGSSEAIIKEPWESIHPDDRSLYQKLWTAAIQKGEAFSHQVRIRRFDGEYRHFMVRAVPLRDQKGGIAHWFGTNMDVHDQWLAEVDAARQSEIAESESKYRTLANSSPQIVFAATKTEGITFANTQWLDYSGQTLEESLHLGFMEHVHPDERHRCGILGPGMNMPRFEDVTDVTTDGNGVFVTEIRLRDKRGEYRWHLVRCCAVESNFGTGDGMWFGTCTDINDHKLLEQKLKEANEAAQKSMESKTRFLANMSHEIRTPLIGISGMVNFLLDTQLTVEQLDYCHTISSSSDGLLSVINDILDLSKVEAGMMRLNFEWFRVHGLVEDAHELLSPLAIAKNLELNYVVEEDVPAIVCGDRVRLRQVLLNVIGNAIKFTASGEVFSRCCVVKDAELEKDEVMLQFECHDTGPGFDKKEEELMFKPFSQIDGTSTRTHGGSGLGLVISRQLIELHGGEMNAYSEKGKGATFVYTAKFRLPSQDGPLACLSRSGSQVDFAKLDQTTRHTHFPKALDSAHSELPPSIAYNDEFGSPFSEEAEKKRVEELNRASPTSSGPESSPEPTDPLLERDPDDPALGLQVLSDNRLDPATMKLSLPSVVQEKVLKYMPPKIPSAASSISKHSSIDFELGRAVTPPMFNILIVAEQHYSRLATAHHIKTTLPPTIPSQITLASEYTECLKLISGEDPVVFTHIIINLPSSTEIIELISKVFKSSYHSLTTLIILTNAMQRTTIIDSLPTIIKKLEDRLTFIYKPIKPSRFGAIFDPSKERDASNDRYRDTAQQVAESQKRVFSEMEKEVGNKGHRVLLVEDNTVNQKVLLRFLHRASLSVETASDGVECVDKVLSEPPYDLILCDLHMPRKDGFSACSEIRAWEKSRGMREVPIVALSANVMSDVAERCVAAGFSRYVTKPVDFRVLGEIIRELLGKGRETGVGVFGSPKEEVRRVLGE